MAAESQFEGSTTAIEGVGHFFFKMPRHFCRSGLASHLGGSACLLYMALCDHANCSREPKPFKVTDKKLAADAGIAVSTIRAVRSRLVKAGLIRVERGDGCKLTYRLLPQTLAPQKLLSDRPKPARKARTPRPTINRSTPPKHGAVAPSESWSAAIPNMEKSPLNHGAPYRLLSNKEGSSNKGRSVEALCSDEEQPLADGATTGGYIEGVL